MQRQQQLVGAMLCILWLEPREEGAVEEFRGSLVGRAVTCDGTLQVYDPGRELALDPERRGVHAGLIVVAAPAWTNERGGVGGGGERGCGSAPDLGFLCSPLSVFDVQHAPCKHSILLAGGAGGAGSVVSSAVSGLVSELSELSGRLVSFWNPTDDDEATSSKLLMCV